jgi:hypothetical protein
MDYLFEFAVTLVAVIGLVFIPEIRKNRIAFKVVAIFGLISLAAAILKVRSDHNQLQSYTNNVDSLKNIIKSMDTTNSFLKGKVDSNLVFLKRLQTEMGIGDSLNRPYFLNKQTITFKNKNSTNVQSFNQKGGQTARDITNNNR